MNNRQQILCLRARLKEVSDLLTKPLIMVSFQIYLDLFHFGMEKCLRAT
jgi:hypothetical protein